uniref:Protein kinase domain-containing protein n=1 Tax=Oryza punctata TaxID=4537 RepID=A0A0E0KM43_ORYPU
MELLVLLLAISCSPAMADVVSYSFAAVGGRAATSGLVVATNSSILSPATFLFDAQFFPVFNESDGFLLLADTVELWRAAASSAGMPALEASFNTTFTVDNAFLSSAVTFVVLLDSFPPLASPDGHCGLPAPTAGAMTNPNATSSLATVEVGTVNSYGRRSPNVGLNVTVAANRTSAPHGLTVWIEYSAVEHHLWVYVTAAGEARPAKSVIDLPLNLPGRQTTQSAFVGFFAGTVRDAVLGIRDWNITVDRFPGDGRLQREDIDEEVKKSTPPSPWLVALLAVLGAVAAVVSVASVVVCYMVSRRRALETERIRQYTKLLFLVCCSLAASAAASSSGSACSDDTSYSFPSTRSEDTLALLEDAEISNNGTILHLTPPSWNKSGTALLPSPVTLWRRLDSQTTAQPGNYSKQDASLNTSFTMRVEYTKHSPDDEVAAGHNNGALAFVIVPTINGPPPPGSAAGFAVEFDVRRHPDDNRITVNIKTGGNIIGAATTAVTTTTNQTNTSVWIGYNGDKHRLLIYIDLQDRPKPEKPCLDVPLNLSSFVHDRAFIGFSSSTTTTTGSSAMDELLHRYSILSWSLTVKLPASPHGLDFEWKVVLPAVVGTVTITALMNVIVAALYLNSKYKKLKMELVLTEALRRLPGTPREFKHATIRKATNNFDEGRKLGNGGFGAVYRGTIRSSSVGKKVVVDGKTTTALPSSSVEVAVKRFTRDENRCYDDFLAEVDIINRLRHRNVVPLVGWSYEKGELLLIYEYMPNGSLDQQLFPKGKPGRILGWTTRYGIVTDIAAGLHYVHHEHDHMVLHRDIKASNILLDAAFRGRLGDFGLARIVVGLDKNSYTDVGVAGTWGFIAPEYSVSHKATRKTDVYAFGVLVLEIVTGRRALCKFQETFQLLVDWVWRLHREGRLLDAVDNGIASSSSSTQEFDADDAIRLLLLGLACSNPNPSDRPSMTEVVQVVARSAAPPDVPLVKPAFVWPPEGGVEVDSDDVGSMASDVDVSLCQWEEEETSSSDAFAFGINWGPSVAFLVWSHHQLRRTHVQYLMASNNNIGGCVTDIGGLGCAIPGVTGDRARFGFFVPREKGWRKQHRMAVARGGGARPLRHGGGGAQRQWRKDLTVEEGLSMVGLVSGKERAAVGEG